jgi:hypothetical protein
MSDNPLDNPAPSDPPQMPMAVVTTAAIQVRQGRMTYSVPQGQVVALLKLPTITTFTPPRNHKLIEAGTHKIGDIVETG